jgi:hypothetical protein
MSRGGAGWGGEVGNLGKAEPVDHLASPLLLIPILCLILE